MKSINIVRALKDRSYRDGLSKEQLKQVGENPAGISELDESMLSSVGGARSNTGPTWCLACQK